MGRHGVFLLYPVLLFGWAAFASAIRRRDFPLRAHVLIAGLCTAAIIGTTTLAYAFSGVSIVFMMVLLLLGSP